MSIGKSESRKRVLWKRLAALVLSVGVGVGVGAMILAAPSSAAVPSLIPPGGLCWSRWYDIEQDHGYVHRVAQAGHRFHLFNQTSATVNWSEELTVDYTYESTAQRASGGSVGIDLGIVKLGVEDKYNITTRISIHVQHRTGFETTVPPHSAKFAEYGAYGRLTSGTYNILMAECGTGRYPRLQSYSIEAFNITSVGWRVFA